MSFFFGFKPLSSVAEHVKRVQGVFDRVAPHYDRMNDAMSLGLHRRWKEDFVAQLPLEADSETHSILDMACGTGDVGALIEGRARQCKAKIQLTLCDLNPAMIEQGREKKALSSDVSWVCGNAEHLPFPNDSFHLYTIAFGLRNVSQIQQALDEAYRVLKPGGYLYCLEFSHPTHPVISGLYDAYSFCVIPFLGRVIAGDQAAYQYLVESIRRFPTQDILKKMFGKTGFDHVGFQNLSQGIVAIHRGQKA